VQTDIETNLPFEHVGSAARGVLSFLAVLVACMAFSNVPSARAADESVLRERPPTKSVEEDLDPLDRAFEDEPPKLPSALPRLARTLEKLPPFFRDSDLQVDLRNYYFRRRFGNSGNAEAWAIGGTLRYQSGWFMDRMRVGAAMFTSQKLHGPSDRDGTGLLRPRQRSYTALGEAFVQLREWEHELTGYRQRLNLPYLNGNDSRMTPNTFEGVSLFHRGERIAYTGGHMLRMKRRNEERFRSFSEVAGVPGNTNKGLSFAGVRIKPVKGVSLGAANYFVKDTLNTAYTELEWSRGDPDGWAFRLGTQFTHQRSVGDDRLTGDSFDTWVWDAKLAASFAQAVVSLAVSVTDDDERIRNPFGSYPGYLAMMQRNFNAADEKAWGISASGYFAWIGLPDLSMALRYTEGFEGRDIQTGRKLGDHREFNGTIDYRISRGRLRGLWLRGRFAWGRLDNARRDSLEGRIVLRYEFQAL
jgi:hypothetical protein